VVELRDKVMVVMVNVDAGYLEMLEKEASTMLERGGDCCAEEKQSGCKGIEVRPVQSGGEAAVLGVSGKRIAWQDREESVC